MRKIIVFFVSMTFLLLPSLSGAVLVNFDSYTDYQNLNGVNLGDVTLTSFYNSVEVYANNRDGASYHSPYNSISNVSRDPLVGVFDYAVSYVSLWAGDAGGDTDSWTLNLYDATSGGNLLGTFNSGDWNGSPYIQLSGSFANIWRFEAIWTGPELPIAYDDLEFTPSSTVPEPTTMLLLGLGLLGLAGFRRKIK